MTDDRQVRALLTRAAELPDEVQPPVGRLLDQARRKRSLRTVFSLLGVTAIVAAAAALPAALHSLGTSPVAHPSPPVGPATPPAPGPTAAQISRFRWSSLPASLLGPRFQPLLTWAGKELIELGGSRKGTSQQDGAAFNPAAGQWHHIASPVPYNVGFVNAATVWTGSQLFVTNGQFESCLATRNGGGTPANCWPHAGLYDPATNSWSSTKLPKQLYGLDLMAAVWTGRDVILAGTNVDHGRLGVAAYDPRTRRWSVITPRLPAAHPPRYVAMVATPGQLLLWSLWDRVKTYKHGLSDYAGIDVLSLGRDGAWHIVTGRWPQDQNVGSPSYTGSAILIPPSQVWCGTACLQPSSSLPGYFVNPATLTRTTIPPGPLGETAPAFLWTGRAIIAVNLNADISGPRSRRIRPDDMALYDLATRSWRTLPPPPGYPALSATPIWTGTQLLELAKDGRLLSFHG